MVSMNHTLSPSIENPSPSTPPPARPVPQWVPVRRLGERHRSKVLSHLLSLSAADRYLRFGYSASDEQIGRYVEGLDFQHDEVYGVFSRELKMVAMAHLAFPRPSDPVATEAEFGVSVSAHLRGKGFGTRLYEHAAMQARVRGMQVLRIHALSENQPMLRLAINAGAHVQRSGADSEAALSLPSADAVTLLESWLETSAAEVDYAIKQRARWLRRIRDAVLSSGEDDPAPR